MKLNELWRSLWPGKQTEENEPLLKPGEDPFAEPIVIEITDVIDLHSIPPKQVKEVVEEYLRQAQAGGFSVVRIIHGKGRGVQRETVRAVLSRTEFITGFYDAPGNPGATIADLSTRNHNLSS